ncbi:MAG: hypothetical protein JWP89_5048 [Schlesneria sp.]|nr:hypothetical protein [Schlesneria sp.]
MIRAVRDYSQAWAATFLQHTLYDINNYPYWCCVNNIALQIRPSLPALPSDR